MNMKELMDLQSERSELLRSLVMGDESVKSRLEEVTKMIDEQLESDLDGLFGKVVS